VEVRVREAREREVREGREVEVREGWGGGDMGWDDEGETSIRNEVRCEGGAARRRQG